MKILLVNDYGTPTGGAEVQMLMLRDAMRAMGHDARLMASSANEGAQFSQADYHCFGTTSRFRTLLQTANPSAALCLRTILREFQPDVVHVRVFLTQLSPLILPLLRRVPSLYHVVWYRAICPLGTKMLPDGMICQDRAGKVCLSNHCLPMHDWLPLMLQLKMLRQWLGAFRCIVANSEAVRAKLLAEGIGPVRLIYNGVAPANLRLPLSHPAEIGFAGRFVSSKGVDILVRAFAIVLRTHPEARLILTGDGPDRQSLRQLVAALGLERSVEMPGHLSRADMEKRFARLWVQCVPSIWDEPLANTVLEAMMRGTAVVASNVGGIPEMVRDGASGFLVPPGDAQAMAAAIGRLLENRELCEEMGRHGREVAIARFGQARCVNEFLNLYHSICNNTASSLDIGSEL